MRSAAVLVGFLLGSAGAAPVPKDFKKPDDKTLIVGKWEVVRMNTGGLEVAKPNFDHTLTFSADGTMVCEYPNGEKPQSADWTLDPTESPKRMRWQMRTSAHSFGHRYAFREDRLVLAHTDGLKSVPLDLAPCPGITVIEYKRADAK